MRITDQRPLFRSDRFGGEQGWVDEREEGEDGGGWLPRLVPGRNLLGEVLARGRRP